MALDAERKSPTPLEVLDIDGNLNSSDFRQLNDDMLALNALGLNYRLRGRIQSLNQANHYLIAWARTYKPTGNPIDEELFYKFVGGYELVRDNLSPSTVNEIDGFLRILFEKEKAFIAAREPSVSHSNWESRHLALVTAIAYTMSDVSMVEYCLNKYQEQINYNILSGGSLRNILPEAENYPILVERLDEEIPRGATFDLIHRDAMEYHMASLEGLLYTAWVAQNQGLDWLGVSGSKGQTLRDSMNFTIPYATGEKFHQEFVRTIVTFEVVNHRGGLFDSKRAKSLLSMAAAMDNIYRVYAEVDILSPYEKVLYYSSPKSP